MVHHCILQFKICFGTLNVNLTGSFRLSCRVLFLSPISLLCNIKWHTNTMYILKGISMPSNKK